MVRPIAMQFRQTADDGGSMLRDKFEHDQKVKGEMVVQGACDCLDENRSAEQNDSEAKQKNIEGEVNPNMLETSAPSSLAA
eukprot:9280054-Alexandrium_andersonii.AAC.1